MTRGPDHHRQAARRHEEAAKSHDRAATFWDRQGKGEQAGLQRRMAEHERNGAELELQWADVADTEPTEQSAGTVETTRRDTRKNAEHLSSELDRTAEALEATAGIAEEHARRREQAGLSDAAGDERRVAARARSYAQRARAQAAEWRKLAAQLPE